MNKNNFDMLTVSFFFFFILASVHLPRIGYNTKNFNWYGTEKLIKKILAQRKIPTVMYLFHVRYFLKYIPSIFQAL